MNFVVTLQELKLYEIHVQNVLCSVCAHTFHCSVSQPFVSVNTPNESYIIFFAICVLQTVEAARAEAERIKRLGEAEAYSVEAVGKAEAESMKLKAQAYKQYGEAAIMSMVLDSLPQVGLIPSQT